MQKSFRIDEVEYKRGLRYGAEILINKGLRPYITNAEVCEIDGEYWLSFDTDEKGGNYAGQ